MEGLIPSVNRCFNACKQLLTKKKGAVRRLQLIEHITRGEAYSRIFEYPIFLFDMPFAVTISTNYFPVRSILWIIVMIAVNMMNAQHIPSILVAINT